MKRFDAVKAKYIALGITEDNIDFAIGAVVDGVQREPITETLSEDYRGMTGTTATAMLNELFEANGGEFKKENSGGYLTGAIYSMIGLAGAGFLVAMLLSGEYKPRFLVLSFAAAIFGLSKGPMLLIKSMRGNYRDSDDPI